MRADFPSVSPSRLAVFVLVPLLAAGVSGCKSKKDPDSPTILGVPAAKAYLGSEYYYNFGAYGGEGILQYSLTNAPSWLGLEDTSNKARQGIIMRGVPGITGGQRGEGDLGKTENITLLTTDGQRVGVQPFSIEVVANELSLEVAEVVEGEEDSTVTGDNSTKAEGEPDPYCARPAMANGSHTFIQNVYDENGDKVGEEEIVAETFPVLVKLALEQPSVTTVSVAFELRSEFNPSLCNVGETAPHQLCDYGNDNHSNAIIGRDVVLWGNGSAGDLPAPDYIEYQQDAEFEDGGEFAGQPTQPTDPYTKGVITLQPGIEECYIRLEVMDDNVPEVAESFTLALTEIREGLASLGGEDDLDIGISIEDDEPRASLETTLGLSRDAINVDPLDDSEIPEYVVRLEGKRNEAFTVKIGADTSSTAEVDTDYQIEIESSPDNWIAGDEVVMPNGVDEARFRVKVLGTFANGLQNDKFIDLIVDQDFAAGREGYAGSVEGSVLRVGINELKSEVIVGEEGDFVVTDMVVGDSGRTFVAGYDSTTFQARVRILDRLGNDSLGDTVLPGATVSPLAPPVIGYAEKDNSDEPDSLEKRIVVSWGSEQAIGGASNAGGIDLVTSLLKFDTAAMPEPAYVEVWQSQSGTAGDDIPRWAGIDKNNVVFISGETSGVWTKQSGAGGVDSFVQRIDSVVDGADLSPKVAWTVQAGSSADDSVVGGATISDGGLAAGNSTGAVNGEPQLGHTDFYFYSIADDDLPLHVRQRGTETDDEISAVAVDSNLVWLVGASTNLYSADPVVNEDGEESEFGQVELGREAAGSEVGFLMRYSSAGVFSGVENFNDLDDVATERLLAVLPFDGGIVVAGSSNGNLVAGASNPVKVPQPILARVSPDGEDDESVLWQVQESADYATVIKLGQYRNDEIIGLIESGNVGSREWKLGVFAGDGRLLNVINP